MQAIAAHAAINQTPAGTPSAGVRSQFIPSHAAVATRAHVQITTVATPPPDNVVLAPPALVFSVRMDRSSTAAQGP